MYAVSLHINYISDFEILFIKCRSFLFDSDKRTRAVRYFTGKALSMLLHTVSSTATQIRLHYTTM